MHISVQLAQLAQLSHKSQQRIIAASVDEAIGDFDAFKELMNPEVIHMHPDNLKDAVELQLDNNSPEKYAQFVTREDEASGDRGLEDKIQEYCNSFGFKMLGSFKLSMFLINSKW